MNTPRTSYPSRSNSAAATELSTPPLMATTTFLRALMLLLASNTDDTPAAHGWHGRPARVPLASPGEGVAFPPLPCCCCRGEACLALLDSNRGRSRCTEGDASVAPTCPPRFEQGRSRRTEGDASVAPTRGGGASTRPPTVCVRDATPSPAACIRPDGRFARAA